MTRTGVAVPVGFPRARYFPETTHLVIGGDDEAISPIAIEPGQSQGIAFSPAMARLDPARLLHVEGNIYQANKDNVLFYGPSGERLYFGGIGVLQISHPLKPTGDSLVRGQLDGVNIEGFMGTVIRRQSCSKQIDNPSVLEEYWLGEISTENPLIPIELRGQRALFVRRSQTPDEIQGFPLNGATPLRFRNQPSGWIHEHSWRTWGYYDRPRADPRATVIAVPQGTELIIEGTGHHPTSVSVENVYGTVKTTGAIELRTGGASPEATVATR